MFVIVKGMLHFRSCFARKRSNSDRFSKVACRFSKVINVFGSFLAILPPLRYKVVNNPKVA